MQPLPLSHAIDVHWIVSVQLWLPVHTTSHAHDVPQLTPRHEPKPEHDTSQGPLPHCTLRHALFPLHSMEHDWPSWQLTPLRHELSTSHWMSHLKPVGQVTVPLHADVAAQSTVQVLSVVLHDVHGAGQLFESPPPNLPSMRGASIEPGTMQKPSTHVRPPLQSDCFVHA